MNRYVYVFVEWWVEVCFVLESLVGILEIVFNLLDLVFLVEVWC